MHLDLGTLLWVMTLAATAMGLAVLLANPRVRRGEGLGAWGLGLLVNAASYPAFAWRFAGHPEASIVATNLLASSGLALHILAVAQFQQEGQPAPRAGLVFVPVLLTGLVALLGLESHRERNALVAALVMVQAMWLLRLALQPVATLLHERGRPMLALGALVLAVLLGARAAWVWLGPEWPDSQAIPPDIQAATYLVTLVVLLLNTIGYMLMHMTRAIDHQRAAATHDALTGALSRRPLMEALEQGLALAMRERQPYAVLMLDLDRFKRVNDEHGHLAGDAVLRQFAQRVTHRLRRHDQLGRYGGEEFLLLLPGTDLAGARTLAEDIRRAVAEQPFGFGRLSIPVTVSIGVQAQAGDTLAARQMAGPAAEVEAMVAQADVALYAAKRNGRNRVEVAPPAERAGPAGLPGLPGLAHQTG